MTNYLLTPLGLLGLLLVHWVADFIAQTDRQAKNKSTSNVALTDHTTAYSAIWFAILFLYGWIMVPGHTFTGAIFLMFINPFCFWGITFVCHTIQDYITSREVKKCFDKGDHHNGFVIIGFDQILHYVQIFLTIKLLYS